MDDRKRQLWLRAAFLALLAGGLLFWARLRAPKELSIIIDFTDSLPGDLREVDVLVTRGGQLLFRSDRKYAGDAPQRLALELRAAEGAAEVDATLVYRVGPARRARSTVELREGQPALLRPQGR